MTNLSKFSDYSKSEKISSFAKELTKQDYYNSFIAMFYFCLVLTYVSQLLSFGSEYTYFESVFSSSLTGNLLIVATVFICIVLESAKYFVFGAFFKSLFLITHSHTNVFLLFIALCISTMSIYASVVGGGKLGINNTKVVATESKHDKEIETLRNEIKEIKHRNTWKGSTYIAGQDKKLLHAKELELSTVKANKASELSTINIENIANELNFRYWFAGFEVVFIICTWFVYYFKKRTTIECTVIGQDNNNGQSNTVKVGFSSIPNSTIAPQTTTQKIGFSFGTGLDNGQSNTVNVNNGERNTVNVILNENERICKHCGEKFTFKHWNATYCGEKCRIENWSLRTGKTFKKGGAKC